MSKSPSLRRIKADIRELSIDPSDQYHAAPLEHDMFEWHFTIRGAPDTDFAGGVYHGRILLPPEYPFKPPNIVFLTPSGRFETGVKVCLSFSAHHPELWQPAWGIRLILEALISFLPTPADGAIGALDWTSEERKKLAKESLKFRCPVCCCEGETCADLLPELKAKGDEGEKKKTKFQAEIEKLKMLQFHNHSFNEKEGEGGDDKKEETAKPASAEGDAAEEGKQPTQPTKNDVGAAPKPPSELAQESDPKLAEKEATQSLQKFDAAAQPSVSPRPEAPQPRVSDNNSAALEPRDAPRVPPPVPANSAPAAAETPAAFAPAANDRNDNNNAPLVGDSLLNTMIGFFAVIVVVLLRQAQSLVDELHGLEDED
eukprot:CAMPEP_0172552826 /NCGR_PEP_ID=MMETSP1067-20121228/47211_1 /TAXON_ID=265564 ORGANISM="Thalassiosira punctigera, Strain Tpunct2005C2" /NCGR_SAMPLE_ID=MMETSP1067 /ASSEMBLY_ACC=CAM_ASM_000444 /LENGTH=370 /DNA_ID=CAMNT_0013340889 /DNA_START=25 /DNA_END=1137 /DNA_ORIENTATION=+